MSGPVYAGNSGTPVFSASNSVVVSVPSGVANGDLLIAQIWETTQSAAAPTCAGWTQAFHVASTDHQLYLFYRYASSEPANYTFGSTNATNMVGRIHRITGAVASGNPFNVLGSGDTVGSGTAITDAAVTTTVANTLVMCFVGHGDGSNAISSYPSGFTGATFTGNSTIATSYIAQASAGSSGTATTTFTGNDDFSGVLGAIAPSSGAALAATPNTTTAATGTLGLKHVVADLVFETTTTTGTGALSLAGAVTGYRAFSSVMSDQDTCLYLAQAVTGGVPNGPYEIGIGTYNASGNTLSRTKVLRSSNSNAAVSFAAGTTNVALTEPAAVLWNKGVHNVGNSGSAITIDWANGPYQMVTLTAACTITFANSMLCPHGELELYQDATGGRVPTITGAVYRSGSAPTWSTTNATHDTLKINYNAVTGASNVFALT